MQSYRYCGNLVDCYLSFVFDKNVMRCLILELNKDVVKKKISSSCLIWLLLVLTLLVLICELVHFFSALQKAMDKLGFDEEGYMVLPSNVPTLPGHKENSINHYIVRLPRPMDLSGASGKRFEVGLSEIAFPHSWDNSFPASRCMYEIAFADLKQPLKPAKKKMACLPEDVRVNNYLHVESLVSGLNERKPKTYVDSAKNIQRGDWEHEWKGEFRVKKQRVQIILCEGDAIEMNKDLATALGFKKNIYFFSEGVVLKRKCGTSTEGDDEGVTQDSIIDQNKSTGDARSSDVKTRVGNKRAKRSVSVDSREITFENTDVKVPGEGSKIVHITESSLQVDNSETNSDELNNANSPILLGSSGGRRATLPSQEGLLATSVPKAHAGRNEIEPVKRYMIRAEKEPNLQFDKYNIYVYCNLVKPTFCGDNFYPLLRTVAVNPDDRNKYVSKTFERIHYYPLAGDFFNEIEIQLAFSDGKPVQFQWGKVVCILHYRERRR